MAETKHCALCGREGHKAPQCPWNTGVLSAWRCVLVLLGFFWACAFGFPEGDRQGAIDDEDSKRGDL
jgi:hypothetical protein